MANTPKLVLVNANTKGEYKLVKSGAIVTLGDKVVIGDVYREGDQVMLVVTNTLHPETLEAVLESQQVPGHHVPQLVPQQNQG